MDNHTKQLFAVGGTGIVILTLWTFVLNGDKEIGIALGVAITMIVLVLLILSVAARFSKLTAEKPSVRYIQALKTEQQELCAVCNYDVRASKDKCPECGSTLDRGDSGLQRTPALRKLIKFALVEAERTGAGYVGSEHFLLAISVSRENVGAQILTNLGVGESEIRDQISKLLNLSNSPTVVDEAPMETQNKNLE